MRFSIRAALLSLVILFCLPVASWAADVWPSKPLRLIVPSAAGSSNDVAARVLGQQLTKTWKQQVIVDNRPGAGTILGTTALARAAPDGYTIGWVISAHSINPSLYEKLPYDTVRDFSGITLVYGLKPVIVAAVSFPAKTVDELIALLRSKPRQFAYASPGTGSSVHLMGELFKLKYGIDMQHVGYKGSASAHPDVISGRLPLMFDALPSAVPQIASGKLKLIAVVSDTSVVGHPEYPLLTGLLPPGATTGWNGIVAPSKTPRALVAKLNADIMAAVRSPEVQESFAALTVETMTSTPERFDAFISEEIVRWREVIKRAGIKIES
jgi:tripartite-type tricarboxylate transporter receptor subunit TctC